MIVKDGKIIILQVLAIAIIVVVFTLFFPFKFMQILSMIGGLLVLLIIFLFRDPARKIERDKNIVVSPADGRVVAYNEISDSFVGNAKFLSIRMSIFDVCVNRMPADGEIVSDEYIPGELIPSYKAAASFVNKRRRINIDGGGEFRYGVTQIAGMVARKIVPYLSKGDHAKKGDKFGAIPFASKVDILLPADIVVQVTLNQKLKAGKTVIGIYK